MHLGVHLVASVSPLLDPLLSNFGQTLSGVDALQQQHSTALCTGLLPTLLLTSSTS